MESDIKNMLRYAMLSTFISFGGSVYELVHGQWAAAFWALFAGVLSVVGYSVISLLEDEINANKVDIYNTDLYNTDTEEE